MNDFVPDASVTLDWLLPSQSSLLARALLSRAMQTTLVVPFLWHAEVANQIGLRHRSGKLSDPELGNAFNILGSLKVLTDLTTLPVEETFRWINTHEPTAYDANYLELATRLNLPLATFDKQLLSAASASGVTLIT